MDMNSFTNREDYSESRLRRHLFGLRNNQVSVALIVLALHGYDVRLERIGEPNASLAKELLDELVKNLQQYGPVLRRTVDSGKPGKEMQ